MFCSVKVMSDAGRGNQNYRADIRASTTLAKTCLALEKETRITELMQSIDYCQRHIWRGKGNQNHRADAEY